MRIEEGGKLQHTFYRPVYLLTLLFNPRQSISIFKYSMINAQSIHCQAYGIVPP